MENDPEHAPSPPGSSNPWRLWRPGGSILSHRPARQALRPKGPVPPQAVQILRRATSLDSTALAPARARKPLAPSDDRVDQGGAPPGMGDDPVDEGGSPPDSGDAPVDERGLALDLRNVPIDERGTLLGMGDDPVDERGTPPRHGRRPCRRKRHPS